VKFVGRTKPPLPVTPLRGIAVGGGSAVGRSEATWGRGNAGRRGEVRHREKEGAFMAEGEAPPARIHGGTGVAAWPSGSARHLRNPRRNESDDRRRSHRHKIGWPSAALAYTRGRGIGSELSRAAGAPDRILPRRGRCGGVGYFFGLEGAPAWFWERWCGPFFCPQAQLTRRAHFGSGFGAAGGDALSTSRHM
jgi:hypothetical protein